MLSMTRDAQRFVFPNIIEQIARAIVQTLLSRVNRKGIVTLDLLIFTRVFEEGSAESSRCRKGYSKKIRIARKVCDDFVR
jgi:hypothetical protein